MMSIYYLIKKSKKSEEIGKILTEKDLHDVKKKFWLKDNANYFILNTDEIKYFNYIDQTKRIGIYESGLFRRINQLEKNKFYQVIIENKTQSLKFVSIIEKSDILYVQFRTENDSFYEIPAHSICEIQPYKIVENQPKHEIFPPSNTQTIPDDTPIADGWYILSIKFGIHDIGSIMNVNKGKMTLLQTGFVIMKQQEIKALLIQIEEGEALFLGKFPIDKRMKKHKSGKFRRIQDMETNQECCVRNDKTAETIYKIVNKNIQHDTITFDLKSKDGSNKRDVTVDASDIKLCKISENNVQDSLKGNTNRPSFDTQASTNSAHSNDSRASIKCNQNILKYISYEPIKLKVMNPLVIKDTENDSGTQIDKFLVIRNSKYQFVVKLLWKGPVDGIYCLGCELMNDWNHGTDGTFNGVKLFACANKRGVLIPCNNDIKSCESNGTHNNLSDGKVIKEENICCVESRESFDQSKINIGSQIIMGKDDLEKYECKWIGLVNGTESIGIITSKYVDCYKMGGLIDTMKLFGGAYSWKYCLIQIKDIQFTIKHSAINTHVINPTFPKFMFEEQSHSEKKLILKIKKKNQVVSLKWKGNVNKQLCIGCDWEREMNFGTDGTFGDIKLFESEKGSGFLIKLDEDIATCETNQDCNRIDKTCDFLNVDDICCMKSLNTFSIHKHITTDQIIKYKNIDWTCVWMGLINGEEAIVVNKRRSYASVTESDFHFSNVFDKKDNYMVIPANKIGSQIDFIQNIYVSNKNIFENVPRVHVNEANKVGDLVQVGNEPILYGMVEFFIEQLDEVLIGIKLSEEQVHVNHQFLKDIIFHEPLFESNKFGIVVKSKKTKPMSKEVKVDPRTSLIDDKSIKYKEKCESRKFQKDDLVKYEDKNEYFRVEDFFLLNGISCISAKKTINILESVICFLREVDVCKINQLEMNTAYFKGTVIDPKSLVTFERCCIEDFKLGDKVKFKLRDSYDITYEGSIICTGRANVISAAVVKLKGKEKSDIIQYQINEIVDSKYNNDITPLLIVPASMLQKQEDSDLLQINGIILVNPKSVKVSNGKSVEEKSIIFTSGDTRHTAILKWKGLIGKRFCVGIEIDFDTDWGTNGTFVDERLFVSQDKRGVLIPIDTLENSCLTGKHKYLVINSEIIDESCICCIKSMGNVKMLTKFKINDRTRTKNGSINGICKWIGLVNKIPAIGVDLNYISSNGTDGTFCKTFLFKCPLKQGALFKEEDLINVQLELKYLEDIQMHIIDPFNIRSIGDGKELRISVIYKGNNMTKLLNIKWRGIVDLDLCVGCELSNETEYGSNGIFSEKKLFSCNDRKGVVIPVYEIKESCECLNQHKEIEKQSGMLNNLFRNIEWINGNSICCVEWLDKIKKWPQIQINSRIKYTKWTKDNGGICKWIGLINGKEAVGVEMDKDVGGSNGRFDFFDLFSCQAERGVLLLAEDVIHDIENEIHFVTDKIVDVNKIWSIKSFVNKNTNKINIDDPVTTCINKQRFNGQLKWMGEINNEKCVGLDMEKEFDYGMDGVIKGNVKFRCMPGHGLVTLLDNITRDKDADTPHFIDEGIIDPNKYLKCQEKWDSKFLEERNIRKNGDVFVIINGSDRQMKMKGVLMWCGFMNKMPVGAVKLDKDHKHGTNGRFWRDQLFKCDEQRAIATSWNSIYQFLPFEQRQIPEEDRVFQEIDINSAVKSYYTADNEVKDLYGTVRWTGVNEDGGYLYGIELDDRLPQGTDGQFKNQRLFKCPNGHGVLAEMNRVTKDTRFTESKVDPIDVPMSKDSMKICLKSLTKLADGLKKGIQGNANSCYFDSSIFALFATTDVLDYLIHPMVNDIEKDEITKQFRDILGRKIVYPLREFGFVSFHKTQEMRDVIQKYGSKFAEITKQEFDMEKVSGLLAKLCPNDQLLKIISNSNSKTNSMFLQLCVTLDKKMRFMSIEEMLKVSMVQNDIMFNEWPTCLIMQAPRVPRGINYYDFCLPSDTIEISDICRYHFKKCSQCDDEAIKHCKSCLNNYNLDISCGFYCQLHSCRHDELIDIPKSQTKSKSKVFMKLQAIICIEKCHFVAYVKQKIHEKDLMRNRWYFFDSMSTQGLIDNYAVPKVSFSKEVSYFLNLPIEEMQQFIDCYRTDEIKRIVNDSYIFIYHNETKTCY